MREGNKSRLNILYVSHSYGLGGAEHVLLALLENLDRTKFNPIVLLPKDGPLKDKLTGLGVRTITTALIWWIPLGIDVGVYTTDRLMDRVRILTEIIEQEDIDLVHTNTSIVIEGALAAWRMKRPHIWHLHEFIKGHPRLKPSLPVRETYQLMKLLSSSIVVVSESLCRSVAEEIGNEGIRIIYNGISEVQQKGSGAYRKELLKNGEEHLICSVGPMIKEKGYLHLVEAASHVIQRDGRVRFVVIGDVGDLEYGMQIQNRLKALGIKDHFTFLGFRQDVRAILEDIDIYVLSSVTESFGMSVVEAMAAGKPVVGTRCGGVEEIVLDGVTGTLVPVGEPIALGVAILDLIEKKDKRVKMGEQGFLRYEELFTAEVCAKEFERLYDEVHFLEYAPDFVLNDFIEKLITAEDNGCFEVGLTCKSGNVMGSSETVTLSETNVGWLERLTGRARRYYLVVCTLGFGAANRKLLNFLSRKLTGR